MHWRTLTLIPLTMAATLIVAPVSLNAAPRDSYAIQDQEKDKDLGDKIEDAAQKTGDAVKSGAKSTANRAEGGAQFRVTLPSLEPAGA